MRLRQRVCSFIFLCSIAMALPLWAAPPAGLEEMKFRSFDEVFAKPGVHWTEYKFLVIDALDLSSTTVKPPAGKHQRDVKPLTEPQIGMLQEAYMKAFVRELAEDDLFTIVATAQEKSLRISATLLEIAPTYLPDMLMEASGRNRVYAESAGSLKIRFNIFDANSGELLMQVVDQRERTSPGMWREINRVEVSSQVRQLMGSWARLFRARFEAAMQTGK